MAKNTILVVEDDNALNEMLRFLLERHGYAVLQATTVKQAQAHISSRIPDVIVLDWMLPGISGIEYARKLKSHPLTADIGLIMLTAKSEEEDKVRGLDCGADDYITKPFSNNELLARIRSSLRRTRPQHGGAEFEYRDISIDPVSRRLKIANQVVTIARKEFELLYLFLRQPNRVYERAQLLDQIWGKDTYVDERTVDVYIRRLRSSLEQYGYGELIITIRGVGYRLNADI
ncbi:MAG: phosphate regulon transcriptional regulatory protein PhoB [Gammaproteobacteria bacterium]|nr:phosphate regulon transcriptional regulatory protein PhoB [Gammaproteobacteria bacterium]NKB64221.1 phosphate regulon transcriptional regulatory protein PhoB [Gammaproteobacteria bacterium]